MRQSRLILSVFVAGFIASSLAGAAFAQASNLPANVVVTAQQRDPAIQDWLAHERIKLQDQSPDPTFLDTAVLNLIPSSTDERCGRQMPGEHNYCGFHEISIPSDPFAIDPGAAPINTGDQQPATDMVIGPNGGIMLTGDDQ